MKPSEQSLKSEMPGPPLPDSGVMVVDKPQGVTSHDVVAAARRLLHTRKVGHAGTLDPMATGVLVLGFGKATRLLNAITDADKTYETVIRLGQSTTTDDAEGGLTGSFDLSAISRQMIWEAAKKLTGRIQQVPSAYSAIRINGRRAYDLARQGEEVRLPARPVTIGEFTILSVDEVQAGSAPVLDVHARVTCSSGTYIRSLGRDLGALLGVGAHLTMLRRLRVGEFGLTSAATATVGEHRFVNRRGEEISRPEVVFDPPVVKDPAAFCLSPAQAASLTLPVVLVSEEEKAALSHGIVIPVPVTGLTAAITAREHELVALLEPGKHHQARPVAVFISAQ